MEGDQVNRKGAMTGGFHDTRFSRIETRIAYREAMDKIDGVYFLGIDGIDD
jgi:hypothetical protein